MKLLYHVLNSTAALQAIVAPVQKIKVCIGICFFCRQQKLCHGLGVCGCQNGCSSSGSCSCGCLIHFAIFSHSFPSQTKVKCKNCNVLVVQGSCAVCSRVVVVYDQVKIQGRNNVRAMHREHTCAHLHHTLLVVLCF